MENVMEVCVQENEKDQQQYKNSTYMLVSKIAYLIGVPEQILQGERVPAKMRETYEELEKIKEARIIRNLCVIRCRIERNFGKIQRAMIEQMKNIDTMPDLIPPQAAKQLWKDEVRLQKPNYKPEKYILDINRMLGERINSIQPLFPIWLNWDYIRELFLMPNGQSISDIRAIHQEYHANLMQYPYQTYINWQFSSEDGFILYNDKKFVTLLYEKHQDYFEDLSRVSDASDITKFGIYEFIHASQKGVVLVVDCENSDPYKLYAVLKNLDREQLEKISKIILYDDVNASTAWAILNEFTSLQVDHIMIQRVKQDKSLTDMTLAVGVCKEFYSGHADSFVLLSSDSDYWALIRMLPEARFLVMVEYEKVGQDMRRAMEDAGVFYCYIDDFCTGNSDEVRLRAVLTQLQDKIDAQVNLNIRDLMKETIREARADMGTKEEVRFYDRYIRQMKLEIDKEGNLRLVLNT